MKFDLSIYYHAMRGSPPSRGAWIEIRTIVATLWDGAVAPLAGGVD